MRATFLLCAALCACGADLASVQSTDAPGEVEGDATGTITCEVLVVGGGLGGIAAANELATAGRQVCLTEETDWLGGQLASQGVPVDAVDGTAWSRSFNAYLDLVLDEYRDRYPGAPQTGRFNPGACGRPLCFEPSVAAHVFELQFLRGHVVRGNLRIFKQHTPVGATRVGNTVSAVTFLRADGQQVVMSATIVIDSTELGDVMPLAQIPYRVGKDAQSELNEPHANTADPQCLQKLTAVLALERPRDTTQDNRIPRPPGYDPAKYGGLGKKLDIDADGAYGWWRWRRFLAPDELGGPGSAPDLTSINLFGANDFAGQEAWCGGDGQCNLVDKPPAVKAQILENAKNHALGYLYWVQNDVYGPNGQLGYYKFLKLRPDVMGTTTGVGKLPYLREGRRLRAVLTVREQEIGVWPRNLGARFPDSLGIANYGTDIKECPRGDVAVAWEPGRKVAIPARALVPETVDGFLAGSKDFGVSHIANGIYRIHQNEWNVGQAAGALAATALESGFGSQVRRVLYDERALRLTQQRLLTGTSAPLAWLHDVAVPGLEGGGDRGHVALQLMSVSGVMAGYTIEVPPPPGKTCCHDDRVEARPEAALTRAQAASVAVRELDVAAAARCTNEASRRFEDVGCGLTQYPDVEGLAAAQLISGYACGTVLEEPCVAPYNRPYFRPGATITRAQLAKIVALADCRHDASLCFGAGTANPGLSDVLTTDWFYGHVAANAAHGYFRGADAGAGGGFGAGVAVTRREAAIWLYNHQRLRLGLP